MNSFHELLNSGALNFHEFHEFGDYKQQKQSDFFSRFSNTVIAPTFTNLKQHYQERPSSITPTLKSEMYLASLRF